MSAQCRIRSQLVSVNSVWDSQSVSVSSVSDSQSISQCQLSVTDSQLLSSVSDSQSVSQCQLSVGFAVSPCQSAQCRIRSQLVSVSSVSDSQLLSSVSAQCRIRSQFIVSVS